jgi:hypothetical protein
MLDYKKIYFIQEMFITKKTNKQPEGFILLSQNEEYFLSKVDIINMKELWRIPLGIWNLSEEVEIFCDLYFDDRMSNKLYFYWQTEVRNPSNKETN